MNPMTAMTAMTAMTPPVTLGASLLDHVLPHELFHLGPIVVTNHKLMMTVAAVVMLWLFFRAASAISHNPQHGPAGYLTKGRFSQMIEVILVFLREEVTRPVLGKLTDRYIGYVWTTFFFILTCNLLGMIPWGYAIHMGALAFTDPHTAAHFGHWQGTPTGNINVTGALAVVSFFMILFIGIRHNGIAYFAHFAPVPIFGLQKGGSAGLLPVAILLVVLEVFGMVIKPIALAMRLFGNMLAGHMVLGALVGLIFLAHGVLGQFSIAIPSVLGAIAMSCLELFVAVLQAYIFAFLTVLFIAQGAVHEHDEHAPAHEPHDEHEHLEDFGATVGVE